MTYPRARTVLLMIDPYNDFVSRFGKAWPAVRAVARRTGLVSNLRRGLALARSHGLTVAYAPHHRYRRGSFSDRRFPHPSQILQKTFRSFAQGSFGGTFHRDLRPVKGDIVASEHACSSGFSGTDLHARLQEKGATHLILMGLLSNTCVESTARSAIDLGYHVTLVPDCVAAWSPADHAAAVDQTYPLIGHAVLTLDALRAELEAGKSTHD